MSDWRTLEDAVDGTAVIMMKGAVVGKTTAAGGWAFAAVLGTRPVSVDIQAGTIEAQAGASPAVLRGAAEAIKWAADKGYWHAVIVTDNDLLLSGMNNWIKGWRRRDWRKSDGTALANAWLWKEIDAQMQRIGTSAVLSLTATKQPLGRLLWSAVDDIALCAAEAELAGKTLPKGWELNIWEKNYANRAADH